MEAVWYCKEGNEPIALVGPVDRQICSDCNKEMINIGWFETDSKDQEEGTNTRRDN